MGHLKSLFFWTIRIFKNFPLFFCLGIIPKIRCGTATDEELEDIRAKCEARAKAEKVGDESVERTDEKATQAAERVVQ